MQRSRGPGQNLMGVQIEIKHPLRADWKKLAKALSHEAIFSAKLLAGEMPPDIEKVF